MLWCSDLGDIANKMLRITIRADVGSLWVLFCIVHFQILTVSTDDIVVACGGFVKSDVEISYSLIEVSARVSELAAIQRLEVT